MNLRVAVPFILSASPTLSPTLRPHTRPKLSLCLSIGRDSNARLSPHIASNDEERCIAGDTKEEDTTNMDNTAGGSDENGRERVMTESALSYFKVDRHSGF